MITTTLGITGMTCNHCVHHIEKALRELRGVAVVEVDLAQARATVTHDAQVIIPELIAAVEAAGYEATARSVD